MGGMDNEVLTHTKDIFAARAIAPHQAQSSIGARLDAKWLLPFPPPVQAEIAIVD